MCFWQRKICKYRQAIPKHEKAGLFLIMGFLTKMQLPEQPHQRRKGDDFCRCRSEPRSSHRWLWPHTSSCREAKQFPREGSVLPPPDPGSPQEGFKKAKWHWTGWGGGREETLHMTKWSYTFPFGRLVVNLRMTRQKGLEGYREIWIVFPGSKSPDRSSGGAFLCYFFFSLVQTANSETAISE